MSTAPCRHCLDADADEVSGLCPACERDRDLATPRAWTLLGARRVLEEDVCGRPSFRGGAERRILETEAAR